MCTQFMRLALIGRTKYNRVLLYLVFSMDWRSSSTSASTSGFYIENFESWNILIYLGRLNAVSYTLNYVNVAVYLLHPTVHRLQYSPLSHLKQIITFR